MIHLTDGEEKLMLILWDKKKALLTEIIAAYDDPKPAKTTTATVLKRLINKKAIDYSLVDNKRLYFPLLQKKAFSSNLIQGFIKNFFNNSASQLASFCTSETNLSQEELKRLRSIIDQKIEQNDNR